MGAERKAKGDAAESRRAGNQDTERRKRPRAYVPMAGTVFVEGRKIGDYLVENLSAGGALLVHGPRLFPGTRLRVVLRSPGARPLSVHAIAVRLDTEPDGRLMTAVRFALMSPNSEDVVQQTVLRALTRASQPSALLVHADLQQMLTLADDVAKLGLRALLAVTPVEVVRRLRDDGAIVQAVIIDWSDREFALRVASFVANGCPSASRVAILKPGDRPDTVALREVDAIVTAPWTLVELATALSQPNARAARSDPPMLLSDTCSNRSALSDLGLQSTLPPHPL